VRKSAGKIEIILYSTEVTGFL